MPADLTIDEQVRLGRNRGAAAPRSVRARFDPQDVRRLDRTVLELRERGLAYPAIAAVLDLYEGCAVEPEQVRYWLGKLGAPTNANMARRPACS